MNNNQINEHEHEELHLDTEKKLSMHTERSNQQQPGKISQKQTPRKNEILIDPEPELLEESPQIEAEQSPELHKSNPFEQINDKSYLDYKSHQEASYLFSTPNHTEGQANSRSRTPEHNSFIKIQSMYDPRPQTQNRQNLNKSLNRSVYSENSQILGTFMEESYVQRALERRETRFMTRKSSLLPTIAYFICFISVPVFINPMAAIESTLNKLFGIRATDITLVFSIWEISSVIFGVPANWMLLELGVRNSVLIGMSLIFIGMFFRLYLDSSFTYFYVGSFFGGAGLPFVNNVYPSVCKELYSGIMVRNLSIFAQKNQE